MVAFGFFNIPSPGLQSVKHAVTIFALIGDGTDTGTTIKLIDPAATAILSQTIGTISIRSWPTSLSFCRIKADAARNCLPPLSSPREYLQHRSHVAAAAFASHRFSVINSASGTRRRRGR
ncbi:MAG: hypothetical protein JO288_17875 [Hyphomicrobiales bacterium]|nr:hypothetical protein [Hyphomicrobiales bacterium]